MRAKEFITEEHQQTTQYLFHGTNLESAESILNDDTLFPGDGSHGDEGHVSFTREFSVALNMASWTDPAGVIFVFDRNVLSTLADLEPFDYGGGEDEAEEISKEKITGIDQAIVRIMVLKHQPFSKHDYPAVFGDHRTQVKNQESVPDTYNRFSGKTKSQPVTRATPKSPLYKIVDPGYPVGGLRKFDSDEQAIQSARQEAQEKQQTLDVYVQDMKNPDVFNRLGRCSPDGNVQQLAGSTQTVGR